MGADAINYCVACLSLGGLGLGIYWNKDRKSEAEEAAIRQAKPKPPRVPSKAHHQGRAWIIGPGNEDEPEGERRGDRRR